MFWGSGVARKWSSALVYTYTRRGKEKGGGGTGKLTRLPTKKGG